MKRFNNLFEEICSVENLQSADIQARKGKLKTRTPHNKKSCERELERH